MSAQKRFPLTFTSACFTVHHVLTPIVGGKRKEPIGPTCSRGG